MRPIRTGSASWLALLLGLSAACVASPAIAASINVLWYTYSDPTSEYRAAIADLAATITTYPDNPSDNTWALTFFQPGDTPSFGSYDVLVIHSGEAWRTQPAEPPGQPYATPDYSGILDNRAAIEAARGDRTFITGSDADFHAIRGDTGNLDADNSDHWDGAIGYVVNAINWAAAGDGLNVVSFYDGEFPGSFWWLDEDSFLHDELLGYTLTHRSDQSPLILNPSQPLNAGLSSAGLSNWDNSFHGGFSGVPTDYQAILVSSAEPATSLAIATALIPLPGAGLLYGTALLVCVFPRRGRRRLPALTLETT